ncbi:MAG: hypothetical protein ACT4PV_09955 [Planctomycetaceae bacterium]
MKTWIAGLFVAILAGLARAQEPPVAELCPPDTFLFLEVDAGALVRGVPQLDLVRLVQDPTMRAFLKPSLQRIGMTGEKPVEEFLARLKVADWLKGRAAIAVRGFSVTTSAADGAATTTLVSPAQPLGADLLLRVLGAVTARQTGLQRGDAGSTVSVALDALVVVEPGPAGKALAQGFLENARKESIDVAGRKGARYHFGSMFLEGVGAQLDLFGVADGERWIFATERTTLESALSGDRRASLMGAPGFATARDRVTCGERLLFLHVDVAAMLRMFRGAVPPLAAELLEKSGVASLRGLALGVSIVEGGVRESVGLLFDGKPAGALRLLEAMPGGFDAPSLAPHNASAFVGVKFDAALLVERFRELLSVLLPGVDAQLDAGLDAFSREMGVNLREAILPAFGDELAMFVHPPQGLMGLPDWVVTLKVRDEAKFQRLIDAALREMEGQGVRVNREIAERAADFALAFPEVPMVAPVCALREGRFLAASNTRTLKAFLEAPRADGFRALARDSAVFSKVTRGLTGGGTERLVAFAYLDLKQLVPLAQVGLMFVPETMVDRSQAPDAGLMTGFFSGLALGVQRDGDALTIDTFSPLGLLLPGAGAGVVYAEQEARRRRAMIEEWRRREEERRRASEESGR